jgi:hypothetical protein
VDTQGGISLYVCVDVYRLVRGFDVDASDVLIGGSKNCQSKEKNRCAERDGLFYSTGEKCLRNELMIQEAAPWRTPTADRQASMGEVDRSWFDRADMASGQRHVCSIGRDDDCCVDSNNATSTGITYALT